MHGEETRKLFDEVARERSLWIELTVTGQLPQFGTFVPEKPHCTLVFLGKGLEARHVGACVDCVFDLSLVWEPILAWTGGVARFSGGPVEGDAVVALLQEPRIRQLRDQALDFLRSQAVPTRRAGDYDYTPHVTLTKVPHENLIQLDHQERRRVELSHLAVCAGDARYERALGSR